MNSRRRDFASTAEVVQIAVVFLYVLKARVRSAVRRVVTRAKEKLTDLFRHLPDVTESTTLNDATRNAHGIGREYSVERQFKGGDTHMYADVDIDLAVAAA